MEASRLNAMDIPPFAMDGGRRYRGGRSKGSAWAKRRRGNGVPGHFLLDWDDLQLGNATGFSGRGSGTSSDNGKGKTKGEATTKKARKA